MKCIWRVAWLSLVLKKGGSMDNARRWLSKFKPRDKAKGVKKKEVVSNGKEETKVAGGAFGCN